ncbi:hypothetical protein ACIA8C_41115 [Nocardia sp. NPDC051321]|uniref:hypothetical protein n=1 Tax=Nocardia sp. NPDC051321 TaxID=3364323 RepID=UPI00378CA28E
MWTNSSQLAIELQGTGVYAGLLDIGALIGNSKAEQLVDEHPELFPADLEIIRMTNDELGEHYWRMYTDRDQVEVEVGFPG